MICPECWDEDHPQLWVGSMKIDDPQTLKRPAIDIGLDSANTFPPLYVDVNGLQPLVSLGVPFVSEWYGTQGQVAGSGISAPVLGQSVGLFTNNTTNSTHGLQNDRTIIANNNFSVTCSIKPANLAFIDQFGIRVQDLAGTNVYTHVWNLTNSAHAGLGFTAGTATSSAHTESSQGNGWSSFGGTFNIGSGVTSVNLFLLARPSSIGSVTYVGDGIPTMYFVDAPVFVQL